jgi:hypothetical protein
VASSLGDVFSIAKILRGQIQEEKFRLIMEEQRRRDEDQRRRDEYQKQQNEEQKRANEELRNMIAALSQPKQKGKGKGKGKTICKITSTHPEVNPQPAVNQPPLVNPPPSTSSGLLQTLTRSVFGGSQSNFVAPTSPQPPPPPPPPPLSANNDVETESRHSDFERIDEEEPLSLSHMQELLHPPTPHPPTPAPSESHHNLRDSTKSVYVTKCALQLNNTPLDQFESKQSVDQAMNDYNQLYLTCGLANSLQSCSITYQQFLNGFFISAWDLSTSGFVGNSYALPNIKTGTFILK